MQSLLRDYLRYIYCGTCSQNQTNIYCYCFRDDCSNEI